MRLLYISQALLQRLEDQETLTWSYMDSFMLRLKSG